MLPRKSIRPTNQLDQIDHDNNRKTKVPEKIVVGKIWFLWGICLMDKNSVVKRVMASKAPKTPNSIQSWSAPLCGCKMLVSQ